MKKLWFICIVSLAVASGLLTCAQPPNASNFAPIKYKPLIVTGIDTVTHAMENQQVSLSVSVKGTPPFTFSWYKNNAILGSATNDTFINLGAAQFSHAGMYKIIVKNDYGADTSSGELVVDSLYDTITYDKNNVNATGIMNSQIFSDGSQITLSSNSYANAGWTFAGWSTSPTGAIVYSNNASFLMSKPNITLYAIWTQAPAYTITFDKNDPLASGTMETQTIISSFSVNLTATSFVKTGWAFAGWATIASGTVAYADGASYTMGSANVTLYAIWTQNAAHTITFDKNDPAATGTMATQSIIEGSSANLTANSFTKAGWTFAGWANTATGAVVYSNNASYVMGNTNVTLFAVWTQMPLYTVTFDKNDVAATGSMAAQSIVSGSSVNLTANAYAKAGWTFAGWATTATGTVAYANNASYTMGSADVTLYAKWTQNASYSITFDKNDAAATGTMAAQSIASGSSANLAANSFAKTGWTFAGWAYSASGAIAFADAASYTMGSANSTLYAVWMATPFTITFDKNDPAATGSMSSQTISSGSSALLTANSYTKPGWAFAGWATAALGTVAFADRGLYTMSTANITLYAKWTANTYAITFDKNDAAANGALANQLIASGSTAPLSANTFAKTGSTFSGWATSPTGAVAYTNGANYTMGTADDTLYAKWTQNASYTITFDKNDGSATGIMASQSIASGTSANLTANSFAKTGWTFAGWATTLTGTVAYSNNASYIMGNANVTLYAIWTQIPLYTVTFNKNDTAATGSMAAQSIVSGTSVNLTTNIFAKAGWTFSGWANTAGGAVVYADGASYAMGSANVNLYAKWTANNYTLSFAKNDVGATGSMTTQTIACGTAIPLPSVGFTKPGWTFAGWAISAGVAATIADGDVFTMGSANTILYAKWTANPYTITFNNGNDPAVTGTMGNQTILSGSSAALTTNGFSKPGWSFAGWAVTLNGSVVYANGASYLMGTANATLYAIWTANLLTITFIGNDPLATGTMANQSMLAGSSAPLSANAYVKPGHTFAGWATAPSGTVAYLDGASFSIGTANAILYAKWTANTYTITFDAQSGSNLTPITKTVTYAAAYGTLATTDQTGYTFGGWWTAAGGAGTEITSTSTVAITSAQTLFAKWNLNSYTITFDAQGGSNLSSVTKPVTFAAAYGTLATTDRTGYTFGGWWTAAGGSGTEITSTSTVAITSAQTLFAKWNPNSYTITFDAQGGSNLSSVTKPVTFAAAYGTLATTDRTGYTFGGWWTAAGGNGAQITASSVVATATAQTLLAYWTPKNYTIFYNSNNATSGAAPASEVKSFGSQYTLPTQGSMLKTECQFSGWNTKEDGTGASYSSGANFTVNSTDTVLYAKWTLSPITMVSVPAGTFQRDGTTGNNSTVSAFRMSAYEITRARFAAIMGTDPSDLYYSSGTTDPVQMTNWYHAIAFCNKLSIAEGLLPVYSVTGVNFTNLTYAAIPTSSNATWDAATADMTKTGYRLPTEMEWMWAAMGATLGGVSVATTGYTKAFAGSTGSIDSSAWYSSNSGSKTHPVGAKSANELGLYDMSGNVYEWCWDWYADNYAGPNYAISGAVTNYVGAATGANRVFRGGCWHFVALYCTVAYRDKYNPSNQNRDIGFRVVRP